MRSLESQLATVVVYRQMSDYDDVVAGGDNDKPSKYEREKEKAKRYCREGHGQLGTCNVPLATTSGQVAASGLKIH